MLPIAQNTTVTLSLCRTMSYTSGAQHYTSFARYIQHNFSTLPMLAAAAIFLKVFLCRCFWRTCDDQRKLAGKIKVKGEEISLIIIVKLGI